MINDLIKISNKWIKLIEKSTNKIQYVHSLWLHLTITSSVENIQILTIQLSKWEENLNFQDDIKSLLNFFVHLLYNKDLDCSCLPNPTPAMGLLLWNIERTSLYSIDSFSLQ